VGDSEEKGEKEEKEILGGDRSHSFSFYQGTVIHKFL
jgi:hypothetical protein